jgi:DNA polymerase-3 subunit delta'
VTVDADGAPHPRDTTEFFGHATAEAALLDAYRSGRTAHAWLLGGPQGIGKATLAYRMARFVLAYPEPGLPAVQRATSLAIPPDHAVARRIAAQAQGDLLVLDRAINEQTGKPFTVIRVDDVRRTIGFFGATAGEGGWRVCIVDTADELQFPQASNALLKILEEPPPRALFLLISHAPGRLLPTIRSRCRRLDLRPLRSADIAQAVRRSVSALLDRLPQTDASALHALGETLGVADRNNLATFVDMVNRWLSEQLKSSAGTGRPVRYADAWEKINSAAREADIYNLDRKPLVFAVFGLLADAARG